MKTVQTLVAIPLSLALAYGAADRYAPGWSAELRSLLRSGEQWSEQAMRDDPVAFLEAARERLTAEQQRLGGLIADLRANLGSLDGQIDDRAAALAKTEAFLREGRGLFQQASQESPPTGIRFAGRFYPDLATFKAQVEILFNEKVEGERLLVQVKATRTRLTDQLYAMLLQSGKVETAIQEVGPQIAMVRAQRSTADVDRTIAAGRRLSEGVLDETARLIEQFPIGTTRELERTAPRGPLPAGASAPAFDVYLRTAN